MIHLSRAMYILLILIISSNSICSADNKPKLAFISLDYEVESKKIREVPLESELTSKLFALNRFTILDRKNIRQLRHEIDFSSSNYASGNSSVEIGNLLGVDYLLFATLNSLSTEKKSLHANGINASITKYSLSAATKLVSVNSGEVVFYKSALVSHSIRQKPGLILQDDSVYQKLAAKAANIFSNALMESTL